VAFARCGCRGRGKESRRPPRARRPDIGAGTSFSQIASLNAAYKIAALNRAPITAFEELYLATRGGARALDLDERIGSLQPGGEADLVVLDPAATPLLAFRNARSRSLEETRSF
jgi:guanine deaminase